MANTKITSDNLDTLTTLTVDDITIDGSTISDSGNLTIDAGGDIILDVDGADVFFKDNGTTFGQIRNASNNLRIQSSIQDADIVFRGDDGGTNITALTLDMSDAGAATFNAGVTATTGTFSGAVTASSVTTTAGFLGGSNGGIRIHSGGTKFFNITAANAARDNHMDIGASDARFKDLYIGGAVKNSSTVSLDAGNAEIHFLSSGTTFGKTYVSSGDFYFNNPTQDKDIVLVGDDGGSSVEALRIDMSEAGDATFNRKVGIGASPSYFHDVKVPTAVAGSSQIVQRIWSENQGWAAEALTEYYTDLASAGYPRAQIGFYRGDTSNNDSSGFIVKTGTSSSGMSTRFKVTATGMVEMPEQPAFMAKLTSSQTITGSYVTVGFNSEAFDRKNNHSNGVFTAPHAGVYLFGANFLVYPWTTGIFNFAFYKDGSNYSSTIQAGAQAQSHSNVSHQCLIECNANDEITVRVMGSSMDANATVYGGQAYWWGYMVG